MSSQQFDANALATAASQAGGIASNLNTTVLGTTAPVNTATTEAGALGTNNAALNAQLQAEYGSAMGQYGGYVSQGTAAIKAGTTAADQTLQPFIGQEQAAGNQLMNLLGTGSGGTAGELSALEQTPGYQFALKQGLQSTQAGFAASGLGGSSAAAYGAGEYAQGLATQTYQNAVTNAENALNSNPNAALAGAGYLFNSGSTIGNALYNAGSNVLNANQGLMGQQVQSNNALMQTQGSLMSSALQDQTALQNTELSNAYQMTGALAPQIKANNSNQMFGIGTVAPQTVGTNANGSPVII